MLNYFLKRFTKIVVRMLILMILLVVSLLGFLYFGYRYRQGIINPNQVFESLESNKTDRYLNKVNRDFLDKEGIWALRLNEEGQVVESFNKPAQVKTHFKIQDVARFTRYYLEDYPVFTYTLDDGLLILAYPKGTLDKLPANYYNVKSLAFDLKFILASIVVFLLVTYWFYKRDIQSIYQSLGPVQGAIDHLYDEDYEPLDEVGDLKALVKTINTANQKYTDLKKARAKWIRGVSHDLRTPLAKISWGINDLKEDYSLETLRKIHGEVLRVSHIIEDLNMTMYLENLNTDRFLEKNALVLLRKLVIDKLNENPSRKIDFVNTIQDLRLKMDQGLFYRMLENILNNSLNYTQGGVCLKTKEEEDQWVIEIKDQGPGIPLDVLNRLDRLDLSQSKTHGLGLFISKQICDLHGGEFSISTGPEGTIVAFIFPKK